MKPTGGGVLTLTSQRHGLFSTMQLPARARCPGHVGLAQTQRGGVPPFSHLLSGHLALCICQALLHVRQVLLRKRTPRCREVYFLVQGHWGSQAPSYSVVNCLLCHQLPLMGCYKLSESSRQASALSNTGATCHMWLLSTWNAAGTTEELNF